MHWSQNGYSSHVGIIISRSTFNLRKSTLSTMNTFGTDTMHPAKRDVLIIESAKRRKERQGPTFGDHFSKVSILVAIEVFNDRFDCIQGNFIVSQASQLK